MGGAPPKKLPFKATALRENKAPTTQPTSSQDAQNKEDDDDCLDLFRHSKKMAPILAAQPERRMLKKKQKLLEEERRKSIAEGKRPVGGEILLNELLVHEDVSSEDVKSSEPGGSASAIASARASATLSDEPIAPDEAAAHIIEDDLDSREPVTPPPLKRPRRESAPNSRSSKRQRSDEDAPEHPDHDSLLRISPYLQPTPTKIRAVLPASAPLITLDSDSEEDIKPTLKPSRRRTSSIEEIMEPAPSSHGGKDLDEEVAEDDEEFAEYIRKAEDQRKRIAEIQSATGGNSKEGAAEIMITSTIPNAHPACLKYQFDRALRLVRDSWIALQRRKGIALPIEQDEDIILTWQRKKVYMTSTLLNLGIRPQGSGKLAVDEHGRRGGGLLSARSKVHFEAWTTELFREMELEEERRQRKEGNGFLDDESEEEEPVVQAEQVKLKLRLKARDLEEVKLTVLPETTVETLVSGFRRQRGVPPDKEIGIYFDGERLEEDETMESAGVENLDTLEVHIK